MVQISWSIETAMAACQEMDVLGTNALSVAIIGPDERSRAAVACSLSSAPCGIVRQLPFYPELDQIPRLLEMGHDVLIIDLDSQPEHALDVIESVCAGNAATVMVYSSSADSELMIRCMRAGAREFLTLPLAEGSLAEAIVRASVRRPNPHVGKKATSRLCVFWGAKGGAGVTMLASNFAVSAARETGQRVLLIDLDLPLGDAALGLGLTPQYSAAEALQNAHRLDANFLSRLLVQHPSGLFVLAAPGAIVPVPHSPDAIERLINIARQDFDCVVVDLGSRLDLMQTSLFQPPATVYLVTQVSIADLRNANRLISSFFKTETPKLEVVLNRFSSSLGIDEEHITRALTRRAQWRVADDVASVRKMQTTATPLAMLDSAVSRTLRQMARLAFGMSAEPEKKKRIIGLF